MNENHDIIFGHDLLYLFHERTLIEARGMVMVFDQSRHQGEVVGRALATGIGKWQHGHVQLASRKRRVLFTCLEQGLRRKNLNLKIDVGGSNLVRNDLRHAVAHIAGRPLMRQAKFSGVGRDSACAHDGCRQQRCQKMLFHNVPPLGLNICVPPQNGYRTHHLERPAQSQPNCIQNFYLCIFHNFK